MSKAEMNEIFPPGMTRQIYVSDLQQIINSLYVRGYLSPGIYIPTETMEKSIYDINNNGIVDFAEHAIISDTATNALNLDGAPACDFVKIEEANVKYLRIDNLNFDSFGNPYSIPASGDVLTWDPVGPISGKGMWTSKAPATLIAQDITDITIDGTEDAAINAAKINELLASLRASGILA